MEKEIKEKLYNIQLVINDIKKAPQTYKTILKELCTDGTCQIILRRKVNKLIKSGKICKMAIPGTRFGKAIFYVIPKDYDILVKADRTGSKVYYFYEYKKVSRYYILINDCWELEKGEWQFKKDVKIFEGNVLRWL